jgi:hypothetical protein
MFQIENSITNDVYFNLGLDKSLLTREFYSSFKRRGSHHRLVFANIFVLVKDDCFS